MNNEHPAHAIDLASAVESKVPFEHCSWSSFFSPDLAEELLLWLEQDATWTLHERSLFSQYECAKFRSSIPSRLKVLVEESTVSRLARELGAILGCSLSTSNPSIYAIKFEGSQGVGIHNDDPEGGTESVRLIVYLNRGFDDRHGGHLLMFRGESESDLARIVRPLHNSAIAMLLGPTSWHAVAEIKSGTRYTLTYSFWKEDAPPSIRPLEQTCKLEVPEHLIRFLKEHGAHELPHSRSVLLNHLVGTYQLLSRWRCSNDVCLAGLFHSVYGTRSFSSRIVQESERATIKKLIGDRAEHLVFEFSTLDLSTITAATVHPNTPHELDLLAIATANDLEQARRLGLSPSEELLKLSERLSKHSQISL